VRVPFVGIMMLTPRQLPFFLIRWEEHVSLSWHIIDLSQTEAIGQWQRLFVNACTTDDEHLLVGGATL
jgi:hypothetical protein